MAEVHVLCLDVGTSSVKAAVVGATRGIVATRTEDYPLLMPRPAWVEQDPVAIQRAVTRAVRSVVRHVGDAGRPEAIAVTGQMFSLQPVAEDGAPLGMMLSWLDQRAASHAAQLAQRVPAEEQVGVTGGVITAKDIVPRIHWLRERDPERWARTRWLLDCKESVVAWLTGVAVIDPTGASAFRLSRGGPAWDPDACALFDVPQARLAPIRSAVSIAGTLRASIARSLGLPSGLPVVVGAGDVPASQLGAGAVAPTDAHLSLGTAAYLGIVADRGVQDPGARLGPLAHVIPGQQLLWLEIATGGGALRWIARALARPGGANALGDAALERMAADSSQGMSGLLFAPWLSGERVPLFDDRARGAFVGLGLHHHAGHLVRAVLEGVAFQLRSAWDYGLAYGVRPGVIRVVGGGGVGRTWLGIIADVLGCPLEVVEDPGDAAAVGVAATALVALGAWQDPRDVVRLVRVAERIEPDPRRATAADASFARFAKLAVALQPARELGAPLSVPRAGVVFDLDGVLVASEHLWEEGWTAYATAHGVAWGPADTRRCQGLSVPEWGVVLGEHTQTDPRTAAAAVVDAVSAAYDAGRVRFLHGAPEMVAAVAAIAPVGLATSAPRRIIETVMDTMGMRPYFSASVSTEEVPRGKPSPDVYAEAIARLGLDPDRSFAVEDSSNGIRAAAASGLTVIGVAHGQYPIAPDAVALTIAVEQSLDQVRESLVRWLSTSGSQLVPG